MSDSGRPVSNAFKRGAFSQNTDECYVLLVTATHSSWDDDIRLCTDPAQLLPLAGVRGTISRGNEYLFLPMQIGLPAEDDSGVSKCVVTIDNIDRTIISEIRKVGKGITLKLEIILASNPDHVEISFPNFKFTSVKYDAMTIQGEISLQYFDLEPFPSARFNKAYFPGLF